MDFGANKIPTKEIKEGWFLGRYFKDIYSRGKGKWDQNSWIGLKELNGIENHYYSSNYYDAEVNKYSVKYKTSLRLGKTKVGLIV